MTRFFLFSAALALSAVTVCAQETVVVSPFNQQGWVFFSEGPNGSGSFVNGPATPPAGKGSVQLTVDGTGRHNIANGSFAGIRFDDITSLSYSTFGDPTNGPFVAITLQFDVDYDLTDASEQWQGRLVFEPYFTGGVVNGVWQNWSTLTGKWWGSSGSPRVANAVVPQVCPQAAPCTWAQVLAAYPNAGIRVRTLVDPVNMTYAPGLVHFRAGGPWAGGFTGSADALLIGVDGVNTLFDFELGPTNKEECKKGGWEGFFRNQGQCVSSFAKAK